MTHPLTDEMMSKIHGNPDKPGHSYDENDMRAVADWQLEQVIKWAKRNCWCWFEKSSQKKSFVDELQKAMRPQENN